MKHRRPLDPAASTTAHGTLACARRRGAAYLMVLGTTLIVATLSLSGLLLARGRLAASSALRSAAEARENALAGVELACLWMAEDTNWRINRSAGVWAADLPLAQGSVSIDVAEPIDDNLMNRPYDALRIRSTGKSETARQTWQVTLNANPEPLPVLSYGLHCREEIRIKSGSSLTVRKAPADTDANIRNDGAIVGDFEAANIENAGSVVGSLKIDTTSEQYPLDPVSLYVALGTEISPGNVIERRVLSPGSNPWGATNPDGVYVVHANNDLTIRSSRIHGTLVVICAPGKKVTIEHQVLIHPFRTDYPTLIIDGDAELKYSSTLGLLELTALTNFNPSGSPYQGREDILILDAYPSEIQGLVHVRGTVELDNSALIRGALLCESRTGNNGVRVDGVNEIVYDSSLRQLPPQGYAARVRMLPEPGTWKRIVQ